MNTTCWHLYTGNCQLPVHCTLHTVHYTLCTTIYRMQTENCKLHMANCTTILTKLLGQVVEDHFSGGLFGLRKVCGLHPGSANISQHLALHWTGLHWTVRLFPVQNNTELNSTIDQRTLHYTSHSRVKLLRKQSFSSFDCGFLWIYANAVCRFCIMICRTFAVLCLSFNAQCFHQYII